MPARCCHTRTTLQTRARGCARRRRARAAPAAARARPRSCPCWGPQLSPEVRCQPREQCSRQNLPSKVLPSVMSSLASLTCSTTPGKTAACKKKPIPGFPSSNNKVEGVLPRVLSWQNPLPRALRFCREHCLREGFPGSRIVFPFHSCWWGLLLCYKGRDESCLCFSLEVRPDISCDAPSQHIHLQVLG